MLVYKRTIIFEFEFEWVRTIDFFFYYLENFNLTSIAVPVVTKLHVNDQLVINCTTAARHV